MQQASLEANHYYGYLKGLGLPDHGDYEWDKNFEKILKVKSLGAVYLSESLRLNRYERKQNRIIDEVLIKFENGWSGRTQFPWRIE